MNKELMHQKYKELHPQPLAEGWGEKTRFDNWCEAWQLAIELHEHELLHEILHNQHQILIAVNELRKEEQRMANTLDDVLADVEAEKTVEDSLVTLTTGLKSQLDAVLSGNLTPAQQAKVDAIFAAVETNKASLAAAITANTPAAPAS